MRTNWMRLDFEKLVSLTPAIKPSEDVQETPQVLFHESHNLHYGKCELCIIQ